MRHFYSRTHSTPRAAAGFTIIEILVAVAITAAIAAAMLAMTTNIMSSWTRASGNLAAQTQARLALDYLQRDLERAIFRRDGNVWFAVDTIGPSGNSGPNLWQPVTDSSRAKPELMNPGSPESAWDPEQNRFGWAGVWLRFFTADSEVNAVSYQIVRRNVIASPDASVRYMLYRSRVSSEATFASGYNIVGADYNPGIEVTAGAEGPAGAEFESAGEVQQPNRESLVASNVVDFGVRLFWKTVDPATNEPVYMEIFPNPLGEEDAELVHRSPVLPGSRPEPEEFSSPPYPFREYSNNPAIDMIEQVQNRRTGQALDNASTRIPNVAEITIRVLTDQGATLLANYEAGLIEGDWWDIVEEHSKLFTRRVVLGNAPTAR